MEPLPTTPVTMTPTAGNLAPLRAGRFIVDSSRHSRSRSDPTTDDRLDDIVGIHEHSSATGSFIPGSLGSPGPDNSPVNRVGRFAVAAKDADILDVIRRNVQANTAKRTNPIQETMISLSTQVQALIERNTFLETENARLIREVEAHRAPAGARAPSVKSETS